MHLTVEVFTKTFYQMPDIYWALCTRHWGYKDQQESIPSLEIDGVRYTIIILHDKLFDGIKYLELWDHKGSIVFKDLKIVEYG